MLKTKFYTLILLVDLLVTSTWVSTFPCVHARMKTLQVECSLYASFFNSKDSRDLTTLYILFYSEFKMCSVDSTVLSKKKIFPDRFCNRELMALECFCSRKNEGCCWKGAFEFLKVGG